MMMRSKGEICCIIKEGNNHGNIINVQQEKRFVEERERRKEAKNKKNNKKNAPF